MRVFCSPARPRPTPFEIVGRDLHLISGVNGDLEALRHHPGYAYAAPFLRAVRDHGILHAMVLAGARTFSVPRRFKSRPRSGPGCVIVLGDDLRDAAGPSGPSAFDRRTLRRVAAIADRVVIDGTAPNPAHARRIAAMAVDGERVLLVQCWSSYVDDWIDLLRRRVRPKIQNEFIVFRPPDGELYPEVPGFGAVH